MSLRPSIEWQVQYLAAAAADIAKLAEMLAHTLWAHPLTEQERDDIAIKKYLNEKWKRGHRPT